MRGIAGDTCADVDSTKRIMTNSILVSNGNTSVCSIAGVKDRGSSRRPGRLNWCYYAPRPHPNQKVTI